MDDRESDPLVDTLTGWRSDVEDPLLAALESLCEALDERGKALAELRAKSDPPPEPDGGAVPQAA